jgi:periplasmic protein CpxP/Spy
MKKIGIILFMVFLGSTIVSAQPRSDRSATPEERAKRQTAQLKELLDLSADQEKQIYELNLQSGKQMAEMRGQGSANPQGMREKMMKMREEQNEKMKAILTEAQWNKYQQYLQERRERWSQGRRRP